MNDGVIGIVFSLVYVSLKEFGVVGSDTYTWGIKDFHKCWLARNSTPAYQSNGLFYRVASIMPNPVVVATRSGKQTHSEGQCG